MLPLVREKVKGKGGKENENELRYQSCDGKKRFTAVPNCSSSRDFGIEVSRPTVYRWMRLPGFPVVRLGNCVRIPAKAFEKWLEDQMETN